MLLWILFALLTGVAVLAVLAPLSRVDGRANPAALSDTAVYRDQLREIDSDVERGVLGEDEAEAARAEVGRRLLAVTGAGEEGDAAPVTGARAATLGVIVGMPLVTLSLYLALGSPDLPGQPLAMRAAAPTETQDVDTLIARVEGHLAEDPQDGRGWEVLAPVYMQLGRYADAAEAWRNVIRLEGDTAQRQADLGEALVAMEDGIVTDDARAAFEAALASDQRAVKPRFYLAVAAEQDGDTEAASRLWRDLIADAPQDAPWRRAAEQRLAALQGEQAPAAMTEEERQAMVEGMVDGLARRLADDGDDLDGWLRLARAYIVLGDRDQARAALASARANFRDDAAANVTIDATAQQLGLGS